MKDHMNVILVNPKGCNDKRYQPEGHYDPKSHSRCNACRAQQRHLTSQKFSDLAARHPDGLQKTVISDIGGYRQTEDIVNQKIRAQTNGQYQPGCTGHDLHTAAHLLTEFKILLFPQI